MLPFVLSLSVEVLGQPIVSKIRSNRCLRQTCIYNVAQRVPLLAKGHTYACVYTRRVDAHRSFYLNTI